MKTSSGVAKAVLSSMELRKGCPSMARHALRWARITNTKVANKCPHGHRKHDPAVVCHEQKPAKVSMRITRVLLWRKPT